MGDADLTTRLILNAADAIDRITAERDAALLRAEAAEADAARLRETLAEIMSRDVPCTCGYGGLHEPENPRCDRSAALADALAPPPGEPTEDCAGCQNVGHWIGGEVGAPGGHDGGDGSEPCDTEADR